MLKLYNSTILALIFFFFISSQMLCPYLGKVSYKLVEIVLKFLSPTFVILRSLEIRSTEF